MPNEKKFPYDAVLGDTRLARMFAEFDWLDKFQGLFIAQAVLHGSPFGEAVPAGPGTGGRELPSCWIHVPTAEVFDGSCTISVSTKKVSFRLTTSSNVLGKMVVALFLSPDALSTLQRASDPSIWVAANLSRWSWIAGAAEKNVEFAQRFAALPCVCGQFDTEVVEFELEPPETQRLSDFEDMKVLVLVGAYVPAKIA